MSLRINLGCSDRLLAGWLNVDIWKPPELAGTEQSLAGSIPFLQCDLRERWPWPDNSAAELRAYDLIEHLPDKIHTMNEAWRVLLHGGIFDIEVPTTDGPGAWQDPTHVSFWNRNSFFYYTDGDPHRKRFGDAYGIRARFDVIRDYLETPGGVPKLHIVLAAVKTFR